MKMRARFRIHANEVDSYICKKCRNEFRNASGICPLCHTYNKK